MRRWTCIGVMAVAGCRYGFADLTADAAAGIDAAVAADARPDAPPVTLDDTICDELTGALLCESFEGATSLTSTTAMPPSTAAIELGRAYRGLRAVHAHTTRAYEPAWMFGSGQLDRQSTGDLYVRAYLYQPASPAPMIAPLHVVTTTPPNAGTFLRIDEAGTAVRVSEPDLVGTSTVAFPRDRWSCVQLHIAIADVGGSVESWIDGTPAGRLDGIDTLPPDGYSNVHVGLYTYGPLVTDVDIWIDELVVTTTPLPCD